ncbi:MAG: potassium channel family protein [Coriobacteriales bacterium]|jgi:trk system potassium uptake protein TrkA
MYIVVNGGGKVGGYLAGTLLSNGHEVAVIEIKHESAIRLARDLPNNALVIEGDGCDSGILIDAGIEKCDIFVATTGRDDTNLVSCELATVLFDVNRCIARVNNPRNERIFRRMGIESVSSTLVISRLIEEEALAGSINALQNLYEDDVCMIEMRIPGGGGDLGERGLVIGDIDLPEGSMVAAVNKKGSLEVATPEMRLFPGDNVILLSKVSVADEVRDFLISL